MVVDKNKILGPEFFSAKKVNKLKICLMKIKQIFNRRKTPLQNESIATFLPKLAPRDTWNESNKNLSQLSFKSLLRLTKLNLNGPFYPAKSPGTGMLNRDANMDDETYHPGYMISP